ncbi:unnamed protein product [marine sediment metagenome]|uniref:Uncharacterized protein n=1 Tax=marine sediment metagenome TaxID=412755 RepID=X1DHY5_9ZZZZ
MEKRGWKITAIIFIVLFILSLLLFRYIVNLGNQMIEDENVCRVNVCGSDERYTAYDFDVYENICYCYAGDEIAHQEIITGKVVLE